MRLVHIETWGCQMNVADSEAMMANLKKRDFVTTDSPEKADFIILNTCHIREKSKHKVISRLGVLREIKKTNPNLKIAVTGCVAQAEGKKLLLEAPTIDMLIGPGKIHEIADIFESASSSKSISLGFLKPEEYRNLEQPMAPKAIDGKNSISRFVTISQGCDNYCTFCVVPYTRGKEVSTPKEHILSQVRAHLDEGAKEITLLGQNVNSYGQDLNSEEKEPFVELLKSTLKEPGLQRLRFTTSNPHDFTKPLAQLFFDESKQMGKYLHLPVQSGSNKVLEEMKRKVTREEYLERVGWLKELVPDIAISTDLIVGFPGETEQDFLDTLDLVEKVNFSFAYAFKYSPRGKTAAARFKDQIPERIKTERLATLMALLDKLTIKHHELEIGKNREVLFLYESNKEPGIYWGRTEHFRLIKVPSKTNILSQILPVEVTKGSKTGLEGILL